MDQPASRAHRIVLLGTFNPAIFHPAWFAGEGLLRDQEGKDAQIDVVHADISQFKIDWLQIQVTREQFIAETAQDAYYEPLRDLVAGTFSLLRHTPVRMMGLNLESTYRASSDDEWHQFGHKLVPKELWNPILTNPGTQSVTVQGRRPDGRDGYVQVTVEPSRQVQPGYFFRVNDHYEFKADESQRGCALMLETLSGAWSESMVRANTAVKHLLECR